MGLPVCVIGKIGFGFCGICKTWNIGRITSGSDTMRVSGAGVARDNDSVKAACGHIGQIKSSSQKKVDGRGIARLSDVFTGDYTGTLIEGIQTVLIG